MLKNTLKRGPITSHHSVVFLARKDVKKILRGFMSCQAKMSPEKETKKWDQKHPAMESNGGPGFPNIRYGGSYALACADTSVTQGGQMEGGARV